MSPPPASAPAPAPAPASGSSGSSSAPQYQGSYSPPQQNLRSYTGPQGLQNAQTTDTKGMVVATPAVVGSGTNVSTAPGSARNPLLEGTPAANQSLSDMTAALKSPDPLTKQIISQPVAPATYYQGIMAGVYIQPPANWDGKSSFTPQGFQDLPSSAVSAMPTGGSGGGGGGASGVPHQSVTAPANPLTYGGAGVGVRRGGSIVDKAMKITGKLRSSR
jgi:hypothetical protein